MNRAASWAIQGTDVVITHNDGSTISVRKLLADAAKAAGLPYPMTVEVRNTSRGESAHIVLPPEHFEKSDRNAPLSHKGIIACRNMVVAYDALVGAGIPEDSLADHTMQRQRSGPPISDIGIWINDLSSARAGTTVVQQVSPETEVGKLTEQFIALGGDFANIPPASAGTGVQLGWLRIHVSKLKTEQAAQTAQQPRDEVKETAPKTEQPAESEAAAGIDISDM